MEQKVAGTCAEGVFVLPGVDWGNVRGQPAPAVVQPALESEEDVGDDWGLRSLAESLPVRYEYDSNTSLPNPEQAG